VEAVTLIEFLRARCDEDEQVARDANIGCDLFDGTGIVVMHLHVGGTRSVTLPSHIARFVARHDPARVLADVAAKRWLVDRAEHVMSHSPDHAEVTAWLHVIHRLGAVYADHESFRDEWRV
jgi:hypothetical protein